VHIAAAFSPLQIVQDLQLRLSSESEVVLTSSAAYSQDFIPRFSSSGSPTYVVGVKPALVGDVQKVIQYASQYNVSFLATSGGHGYSWSLSSVQGAIDLDLSNFDNLEIDESANTITVGPAWHLSNITSTLQAIGKELPVGQCPTAGLAGITLGGGVGPYGGMYGAISDSLLSVEIITGTGNIFNVSATQHPDLFWGIKGAGFNYGVVTSLTYRIYPATNNGEALIVNALFTGPKNASVWRLAGGLVGRQPKEFTINLAVQYNATLGGMIIAAGFIYVGPQAAGMKYMQPFLDLSPIEVEINYPVPYDNFTAVLLYGELKGGTQKGVPFVPYAVNLYQVDVENLIELFNYMNQTIPINSEIKTATLSWAQFSSYGFHLYPDSSSAFPYRDVAVFLQFDGFALDASDIPSLNQFGQEVRRLAQKGSGSTDLETYVNFGHGDEGPAAWYSARKLPALRALKAVYDPGNLFRYYN
ncbi:hypothetical protein OIDMADRAFT_96286, partial [Oidiodendron maius Zn]